MRMLKLVPRKGKAWAHEAVAALDEQTVEVTGTTAQLRRFPASRRNWQPCESSVKKPQRRSRSWSMRTLFCPS